MLTGIWVAWILLVSGGATRTSANASVVVSSVDARCRSRAGIRFAEIDL